MKQLTAIFKYYLGNTKEAPAFPDEKALIKYATFAQKQGIAGFLLNALTSLPDEKAEEKKESDAFTDLLSYVFQIEQENLFINVKLKELAAIYHEGGFQSCVLKGQGLCKFFPEPLYRTPGDIDLWVRGSRKDILAFTRKKALVDEVVYHHLHAHFFEKPETEIHFIPTWMFCPLTNHRLQNFFLKNAEEVFANWDESLQCATPTPAFNAVFLMVHTYRHLFDEGINLKQLLDYYFTLQVLTPEERTSAMHMLERLHMTRFTRAMMAVLHKIFGLKPSLMLIEPDAKAGKDLFMEIVQPSHQQTEDNETFWQRNLRRAKHRNKLLRTYPEEVIWAPVFKTIQLVWRRKNGY